MTSFCCWGWGVGEAILRLVSPGKTWSACGFAQQPPPLTHPCVFIPFPSPLRPLTPPTSVGDLLSCALLQNQRARFEFLLTLHPLSVPRLHLPEGFPNSGRRRPQVLALLQPPGLPAVHSQCRGSRCHLQLPAALSKLHCHPAQDVDRWAWAMWQDAAAFLHSALSLQAHVKAAFLILKLRWLPLWASRNPLSVCKETQEQLCSPSAPFFLYEFCSGLPGIVKHSLVSCRDGFTLVLG